VLRLDFDWRVVPQFRGATITSDAGLLPYRELDDAAGLTETSDDMLADAHLRIPVLVPEAPAHFACQRTDCEPISFAARLGDGQNYNQWAGNPGSVG
jgi:hypothetical protein